jgi:hypothetical protein
VPVGLRSAHAGRLNERNAQAARSTRDPFGELHGEARRPRPDQDDRNVAAVALVWGGPWPTIVFMANTRVTPANSGMAASTSPIARTIARRGYLPIAMGRKRRGLQDYLARTIVVDAPEQSVADAQRIAAQANRTRALTVSGAAPDAPDGHSPDRTRPGAP